jgi:hypothetical protein
MFDDEFKHIKIIVGTVLQGSDGMVKRSASSNIRSSFIEVFVFEDELH